MECARCKQLIPEGEECNYNGKVLCEDCYIQAIEPLRTCDVAAVHSAKTHRAMYGQTGTDGLTELQKNIYEYVKKQGKATKPELISTFGLSALELDKQISILRHCELTKARKVENEIYIVLFDLE
jgi:predicted HTH transcriptional regulator